MKVKTIWDTLADGLDKQINDFIQHKHVVDIKFSTCTDDKYDDIYLSALIMYEDMKIWRFKVTDWMIVMVFLILLATITLVVGNL